MRERLPSQYRMTKGKKRPVSVRRRHELEMTKGIKKGQCALFFDGVILSGPCTFTGIKTAEKDGDAIFQITLIKAIPAQPT